MAEGGDFGYDDPDLDYQIDHDDDDDDQEVNRTQPFQPGAASTPYHGGEQHEMQTMMHEQEGLPDTSYDKTPLLRRSGSITDLHKESLLRRKIKKAVDFIKEKFPTANFENIKIRRGTGKNTGQVVAIGPKGGEYKVLKGDESGLMKNFLDSFKNKLGPSSEEIISQDRNTAVEQRQRLAEAESQQREAAAEIDKELQEIQNLRLRNKRADAKIEAIQEEEQGSNLESETEQNRLEQLKKNNEEEMEIKKKRLDALQKKQR